MVEHTPTCLTCKIHIKNCTPPPPQNSWVQDSAPKSKRSLFVVDFRAPAMPLDPPCRFEHEVKKEPSAMHNLAFSQWEEQVCLLRKVNMELCNQCNSDSQIPVRDKQNENSLPSTVCFSTDTRDSTQLVCLPQVTKWLLVTC